MPGPTPVLELTATAMAAGGDAVSRDGRGRVVFVRGALPGETVEAEVVDERTDFARAVAVAVLDPSPDRMAPPCPHVARGCGGCGWQHVEPTAQVRLKLDIVSEALRRQGGLDDPVVTAAAPLASSGYRTTLRLAVTPAGAGFHRHHGHDVVEVDSCLVAHPRLQELLAESDFGAAVEVTLRCSAATGERLALVSPDTTGVETPADVQVVGLDEVRAGRRAWIHEEVAGHRFRVSARSFFQARPDGAEQLVGAVRHALRGAPEGPFVDLYGGVGLFAATVAGSRRVTVVERSASSVADARANLPGARVLLVDVDRWRPSPAKAVVADPSRTGLGRAAVRAVERTGTSHLALVSCDPASLGRDARLLASAGFRHEGSTVVDLFPHTPHVEVVSRFVRDGSRTTASEPRRVRRQASVRGRTSS
ncbi:MAG TPA: TRAM domain-containing protein [Acidimicrobiales bacterium]